MNNISLNKIIYFLTNLMMWDVISDKKLVSFLFDFVSVAKLITKLGAW